MDSDRRVRMIFGFLGAILVPLLVYASILPLQYVPIPWDLAVERWNSIPWLKLGVANRADWIANGLVVVPITYLLSGAFSYGRRIGSVAILYYLLLIGFIGTLLVGIECLQVWFPRRTMSINDIVSGWIGCLIGVFSWLLVGEKTTRFTLELLKLQTVKERIQCLAIAAGFFSVLYSLYPFDLVLNREEFYKKIAEGKIGLLGVARDGVNTDSLKSFFVSVIRMLPFGVLIAIKNPRSGAIIQLGFIALLLEVVQIPIYSKYSSIVDWIAGWISAFFAFKAGQHPGIWQALFRKTWIWLVLTVIWLTVLYWIYICVVPFNLGRTLITDSHEIRARWGSFIRPPFVSYYFPSEYVALTNFVGKFLTFSVLGALLEIALESFSTSSSVGRRKKLHSAVFSLIFLVALLIEFGQIYVEGQSPDVTDVLIYLMGGLTGCGLVRYVLGGCRLWEGDRTLCDDSVSLPQTTSWKSRVWFAGSILFSSVLISLLHPGWPHVQTLIVLLLAGVIFYRSDLYPFIYVLALVTGDLYPLTGMIAIQEYDSLLLGATGGYVLSKRQLPSSIQNRRGIGSRLGWMLLVLSLMISGLIGVYRLPYSAWGDQLSIYFTSWNVLRIGKGVIWGVVFYRLMSVLGPEDLGTWRRRFLQGMITAAAYVGVWVCVERALFPGWNNIHEIYRATGPFFTMHIGDQHIDAFLAIAFPIVLGMTFHLLERIRSRKDAIVFAFSLFVCVLVCHAVFATMSRGAVLAAGIQIVLVFIAISWRSFSGVDRLYLRKLLVLGLPTLSLLGLTVYSVFSKRFEATVDDTHGRLDHWGAIIERGTSGLGGVTIGHGIGTFPSMMALEIGRTIPPLAWKTDGEEGWMELQSGWPIFLDRLVQKATLDGQSEKVWVQSVENHGAMIGLYRVQKSLLHSYGYQGVTLKPELSGRAYQWPIGLKRESWDSNPWFDYRPIYVGVSSPSKSTIRISNAPDGDPVVSRKSSYPWIFTCDDHMVWRAKNFLVHSYYEQGLLGVLAWTILVLGGVFEGMKCLGSTDFYGQSQFWTGLSVLGFAVVGMFGTLIDTHWITALILACVAFLVSFPRVWVTTGENR